MIEDDGRLASVVQVSGGGGGSMGLKVTKGVVFAGNPASMRAAKILDRVVPRLCGSNKSFGGVSAKGLRVADRVSDAHDPSRPAPGAA
mmetsp:Transcript_17615/g.38158  ORF Transcript_17615/g.38158 Transcript_17615/m.38158 type:complete len:88 (-) Transcript_17615:69-332(-)